MRHTTNETTMTPTDLQNTNAQLPTRTRRTSYSARKFIASMLLASTIVVGGSGFGAPVEAGTTCKNLFHPHFTEGHYRDSYNSLPGSWWNWVWWREQYVTGFNDYFGSIACPTVTP